MLRSVPLRLVLGLLLAGSVGCQSLSNRMARNPLRGEEPIAERDDDSSSVGQFVDFGSRRARDSSAMADDRPRRARSTSLRREVEALDDLPAAERDEIATNLESLDPATAQIVLRALQQSRNVPASPDTSGPRIASSGIRSGSAGVRTASGSRVLGSPRDSGNGVRPAGTSTRPWSQNGLGDASPWGPESAAGEQPTGSTRTALRPRSGDRQIETEPRVRLTAATSPAPETPRREAPRTSSDRIDHVAERLAGQRPSASANASPKNAVTEHGPVRNAVATMDDSHPNRRVVPVGVDRTIPSQFSTTAPGSNEEPTAPASPYESAIRHLEQAIAGRRAVGKPTEAQQLELVENEVFLRLLYLADGQEERAIVPIEGIPAEEQEFWKNVLWSLANYFDDEGIQNPTDRTGQVLVQMRNAIRTLQSRARLELRNVALCEAIRSFGDYTPLESNRVPSRGPVIVYAEVENFRSVMTDTGNFVTRLKPTIEFYREGDDRTLIKSIEFDETVDFSRNHRRDYYLAFDFHLPAELSPGRYKLVLQLDDGPTAESTEAGRMVTQTLQFEVTP